MWSGLFLAWFLLFGPQLGGVDAFKADTAATQKMAPMLKQFPALTPSLNSLPFRAALSRWGASR
jgi:hypothetical protein